MYLFIFESIGTSELLLIGAVALIVFGPRKLPQMARTLGKAMADFKNTTNEFKSTWEREANFEETTQIHGMDTPREANVIQPKETTRIEENPNLPEIKEIDASQFKLPQQPENKIEGISEGTVSTPAEKQNWL